MSKTIYSLIGVTAVSVAVLNIPATTATSASSQAQASVNVHTTCSMTATVNTAHNATLISGTYSSGDYPDGIGKTTIQTFCNDQSGYAIYAIGFTNNQLGSTVLKGASLSSDYDIATGTATSGDTSSWAMKISAVSGTYAPTINNGYSSFSTVPSSWTKVASLTSSTDSTSTTSIGSKIETTYAAYISNAQPAGTYSGQVRYVLVHPSSIVAGTYTIAYNANGDTGTMTSSTNVPNYEPFTLPDSTFTAPSGYQFAGWCTTPGTSPYTTCSGTSYSAGDSVTSLATAGSTVNLYAYWELGPKNISNSTYLQEVASCPSTLTTGQAYTLLDSRDNTTYHVAKLADGRCWMLDNLALDLINVSLSDLQGKTNASNAALNYLKNGGGTTTDQYPTAGITTFTSANNYSIPNMISSGACYDSECVNDPTSGNWTKDSVVGAMPNSSGYNKIGIYYNYCAASAGTYCWGDGLNDTGSPSTDPNSGSLTDIDGDICPLGWKMPTSDNGSEYGVLYSAYSYNDANFRTALSVPFSGRYDTGSARLQGRSGFFWSSTWYDSISMRGLAISTNDFLRPSYHSNRRGGESVRCVAK